MKNGLFSLMLSLMVAWSVQAAHYGVFVGINQYDDASFGQIVDPLGCCVDDARSMRASLIGNGAGWSPAECTLLTNSLATKAAIRSSLSALAATAQPGDTVVYFHSGHGGPYDGSEASYLLAHNDFYEHWELAGDLAAFSTGVKLVVIVDACNSGGLFKELPGGLRVKSVVPPKAWNFAEDVRQAMQDIRTAQIQAKGQAAVAALIFPDEIGWMTACAFNQDSFELPNLGHGVFTYSLLEGMVAPAADGDESGEVTCLEAFAYAEPLVNIYLPGSYWQDPQKFGEPILAEVALSILGFAQDAWDPVDDTFAGATLLQPTREIQTNGIHQLTYGADESDFFAIPVRAGRIYTFQSVETTPVDGGNSGVEVYLYRLVEGTLKLIRDVQDVVPAGLDFHLAFEAPRTETVYLKVAPRFSGGTRLFYQLAYAIGGEKDSYFTLTNNVSFTWTELTAGQVKSCRFVVPSAQSNLTVMLESETGDCDLYLAHGRIPTDNGISFDSDYNSRNAGLEDSLSIPSPDAGEWFILIDTFETASTVRVVAVYSPGAVAVIELETHVDAETGELCARVQVQGDTTTLETLPVYIATNLIGSAWGWQSSPYTNIPAAGGTVKMPADWPFAVFTIGRPPG